MENQQKRNYFLPISILIAGVLISGAVVYSVGRSSANLGALPQEPPPTGNLDDLKPITGKDHIKGDSKAPVKIVEFSDTECPFCKRIHPTLQQIVKEYNGKVAWVYRHFPLDQLHSKARMEAAAAELAGELGGNDKFWAYLDRLFEITPSNDQLELSQLVQIAKDVGLNPVPFEKLVKDNDSKGGKFAGHIEADAQDAIATGGNGTPWSIVVASNGKKFPVNGAQPYEAIRQVVELALKEK